MAAPSAEQPVFVDQTKKFVRLPNEREYVTTSAPFDDPLFRQRVGSDEVYGQALSSLVIDCVDLLIYNPETEKFLIGTRQQEPHAGDWVIGGRMVAGDTVAEAASRNMKRELGLDINTDKLRDVGHYQLVWDSRAQQHTPLGVLDDETDPHRIIGHSTGCHMASNLELYPLSKAELEQLEHNEEYSLLRWLSPNEILEAPTGEYHPCLVDMVHDGLEVITTPDAPHDAAEQRLRLAGAAATATAALRRFDATHPNA